MITINGTRLDLAGGQNLRDFLQAQGYDQRVIVVGLNETIVPKAAYASVVVQDGDVLEILNFVSGG
jgi:sulfur carrier protein